MALKKKSRTRRPRRTRRSRTKRSFKIAKRVNLKHDLYYFTRYVDVNNIQSAGTTDYFSSLTFSLASIPNVGDFTSLFDQYKITKVELFWKLAVDPSAQTSSSSQWPTLYYVNDHDDSTPFTSINQMRECNKMRFKVLRPFRYAKTIIKPAVLSEIYRSAVSTSYVPKWNQWVDMVHTDVPHYGVKYAFDYFSNLSYVVQIRAKYHISFRHTR